MEEYNLSRLHKSLENLALEESNKRAMKREKLYAVREGKEI